jgi:MraZ protein
VELDEIFEGHALSAVDAKGRLAVPAFVRSIIEKRSEEKRIIIGTHERLPCLIAYDRTHRRFLSDEHDRRRLIEEAAGDFASQDEREHRYFGFVDNLPYDSSGRIVLSEEMRGEGGISNQALFVGARNTCQIWDPKVALERGDPVLRRIATTCLARSGK